MQTKRIILAITGASATLYGVRMLEILQAIKEVEVHLILSDSAKLTLGLESDQKIEALKSMADTCWDVSNMAASISSGSYPVDGMIVLPCSMKTLASIALSLNQNLISRAADVQLKERRKLVVCPRETPLHQGHLEHMLKITQMGGVILPPMPAFYHQPKDIQGLMDQTLGKILDQFGIAHQLFQRWEG